MIYYLENGLCTSSRVGRHWKNHIAIIVKEIITIFNIIAIYAIKSTQFQTYNKHDSLQVQPWSTNTKVHTPQLLATNSEEKIRLAIKVLLITVPHSHWLILWHRNRDRYCFCTHMSALQTSLFQLEEQMLWEFSKEWIS